MAPPSIGGLIVQAKLTVGPAGDPFEREADEVASRVVRFLGSSPAEVAADGPRARRSAMAPASATSIDESAGAPGLALRRVQRSDNATAVGERRGANHAGASSPAAPGRIQRSGLGDWVRGKLGWGPSAAPAPERDPLQKVHDEFMQRITALQGEIPQLKGQSVTATGEALWAAYAATISGAKGMSAAGGEIDLAGAGLTNKVPESAPGIRNNRATNPMYYDGGPTAPAAEGGQLAQGSYKTNMSESFNLLTNALKGLSQLQFDKYQTFAFWNSPGAKEVAVAAKSGGVLALESSAIGGLFDGFGSYEELAGGIESTSWDPQLWAELSRAYAAMVIDAIVKDPDKRIVVICGLEFNNPGYNIWNSIESLTLALGARRAKLVEQDLQAVTTYLGVAGRLDGRTPIVDMTSSCAGVDGTWVSTSTAAEMTVKQQEQAQRTTPAPV